MKKKQKQSEQMEFTDAAWEKFFKTELGKALNEYVETKRIIEGALEKLEMEKDKVAIEMKKAGKLYIKPQIDGVFYEFELLRSAEKLKFKRAKI